MKKIKLPDYKEVAQKEAEQIKSNKDAFLRWPLERILMDSPFVREQDLLEGLEKFHKERMEKVPSPVKYPESKVWVEYIIKRDNELRKITGMNHREMAIYRSLHDYCRFRGFVKVAPVTEKCRVAYIPESDYGRIHIKNVDDPNIHWKPETEPRWLYSVKGQTLWSDGVGSGLHIDDEPEEIFPLSPREMFRYYADDVPSAVDFLTRYSPFWGSGNLLLHDSKKRSVAIEKCSYNFIEVFYPDSNGCSYISGMVCRDPDSPQGRYQRSQRMKYMKLFGLTEENSADMTFWNICEQFEVKLSTFIKTLSLPAKLEDVVRLFTKPWPEGLCKTGQKFHPKQSLTAYTLITYTMLPDVGKLYRWQRGPLPECKYPEEPEVFSFEPVVS